MALKARLTVCALGVLGTLMASAPQAWAQG
jgi:hypothetical protein